MRCDDRLALGRRHVRGAPGELRTGLRPGLLRECCNNHDSVRDWGVRQELVVGEAFPVFG